MVLDNFTWDFKIANPSAITFDKISKDIKY